MHSVYDEAGGSPAEREKRKNVSLGNVRESAAESSFLFGKQREVIFGRRK